MHAENFAPRDEISSVSVKLITGRTLPLSERRMHAQTPPKHLGGARKFRQQIEKWGGHSTHKT